MASHLEIAQHYAALRTIQVQLDVGICRGGLRVFTQHAAQTLGKRRVLHLHPAAFVTLPSRATLPVVRCGPLMRKQQLSTLC